VMSRICIVIFSAFLIGACHGSPFGLANRNAEETRKTCTDSMSGCKQWALKWYCPANGITKNAWAAQSCRKTCGLCDQKPEPKGEGCYDKWNIFCPRYKKSICKDSYKNKHCKKTCGLCKENENEEEELPEEEDESYDEEEMPEEQEDDEEYEEEEKPVKPEKKDESYDEEEMPEEEDYEK